jgi:hypothetical protein
VDTAKLNKIKQLTGFLPRELKTLRTCLVSGRGFLGYEKEATQQYQQKLVRLCDQLKRNKKIEEFNGFLLKTLSPKYSFDDTPISGSFYDQGLFFYSNNKFECISAVARTALTKYIAEALRYDLKPILSYRVC